MIGRGRRPRFGSRLTSLRRTFGQTRPGRAVHRARRSRVRLPRAAEPDPALLREDAEDRRLPAAIRDAALLADARAWAEEHGRRSRSCRGDRLHRSSGQRREIRNVLLVSHTDFTGNSAYYAYRIAVELEALGFSPVMAIPGDLRTVKDIGRPQIPVVTYRDLNEQALAFRNGRGIDVVHAITPRELVRKFVTALLRTVRCPYVVHFEDNDEAILSTELGVRAEELAALPAPVLDDIVPAARVHPLRGKHFAAQASAVSVVTDRLRELAPPGLPAQVVPPGFDEAVLSPSRPRDAVRGELGVRPDDFLIVYTGSVHGANAEEMRALYDAIRAMRSRGRPVVLLKTGWNMPDAPRLPELGPGIRDLGWVPRSALPPLLAAADCLVQPGAPNPFNDYRFPSKLPDFLASGKPVVLPRSNLGLALADGQDAILLEKGSPEEICQAIERIESDPVFASRLGANGQAFALRELRWALSAQSLASLYHAVEESERPVRPPWTLELDPPVKVVALVSRPVSTREARIARAHGVYGFCVAASNASFDLSSAPDVPFCLRIDAAEDDRVADVLGTLAHPGYMRLDGAPLVVADESAASKRWRDRAASYAGGPVHFALLGDDPKPSPTEIGFDSVVEMPNSAATAASPEGKMIEHLARPLPAHTWFRGVVVPSARMSRSTYTTWLRKLVLQTLSRAAAQSAIVFVDFPLFPLDRRATSWLKATRSGLAAGLIQFYRSQTLEMSRSRAAETFRLR